MKNYFSTNLKLIRKSYHLTQDQLGHIIGKTYSAISLYERDLRSPTTEDILTLSEHFAISPSDLCFTDLSVSQKAEPLLTEQELELLQTFRRMPENQRNAILDMMRSMV